MTRIERRSAQQMEVAPPPRHLVGVSARAVPTAQIPERVRWAIDILAPAPTDDVLEIGCGPGHAVALLCARLTRGTITAIDRSAIQVARARDRNRECIAAGRARIECAALADLDTGRRCFDKIFAVNVNAFWTSPAGALADARRLLTPRGTLHLVYEPPSAVRLRDLRESLAGVLHEHGFEVVDVAVRTFRASHGLCIIGRPG